MLIFTGMIENLDDLSPTQKAELQKFVNIAYENKNLWWTNGDILKGEPIFLPLKHYFSWKIDILNELLINFPVTGKDVNDKVIKKVLQIFSDDELMENYTPPSLDIHEAPLYCFRFKKQETLLDNDNVEFNVEDLSELNTRELLDNLQSILNALRDGKFDRKVWNTFHRR